MASENTASVVAQGGLCSGCGVCAGLCPTSALRMQTGRLGDLEPVLEGRCLAKCSICVSACPFSSGLYDPRQINTKLFMRAGDETRFHENIGWHRACFAGHVTSTAAHARAASGGLATWCLQTLLRRGLVDKVAVVGLDPQPHGALFRFVSTSDPEEVARASGSVYHPIDISNVVREVLTESRCRWALIGVPCLCAAVRRSERLGRRVRFLFGLTCGMYQNTMYTEFLAAKSGVRLGDVGRLAYREKTRNQPVSNYAFRAYDGTGEAGKAVHYWGEPCLLGRHAHFRLNACNYCMDVFAETADAAFMDAWLPEYQEDARGTSLAVVRDPECYALLKEGARSGALSLTAIAADSVAASQRGAICRKQELIHVRQRNGFRGKVTSRTGLARIQWRLEQLAQRRSKRLWASVGRKNPRLFWMGMADLVVGQWLTAFVPAKAVGIARRIRLPFPQP